MTTSLADSIKKYEPLLTSPAQAGGRRKIGYGHDASVMPDSATCDSDRAEAWLAEDATRALTDLAFREVLTCNMEQPRREALAHLCFWLGADIIAEYERAVWLAGLHQYQQAASLLAGVPVSQDQQQRLSDLLSVLGSV